MKAVLLSARQREVLSWIERFIQEHEMPPTVREIGDAFGIKSSSVFDLLKTLERKGYVKRGNLGARSLTVCGATPRAKSGFVELPVVGRIAAGGPIEAVEQVCGMLSVQREMLKSAKGFVLQVVGESMIDAGIQDGDYVIVRQQSTAKNGDIVVALIGDDATLKRFYRESGSIRLQPANRAMRAIQVRSGEFRIKGIVVGVQRRYDRSQ